MHRAGGLGNILGMEVERVKGAYVKKMGIRRGWQEEKSLYAICLYENCTGGASASVRYSQTTCGY